MWFLLGFCAISPFRKDKQRLKMSLAFNNCNTLLVSINMLKFNKKDTRTRCEICSKLTIKTPERRQFVSSLFLTLNIFHTLF